MIEHRVRAELGGLDIGWLSARHHFPIGYGNNVHRPVGRLYVWNDDEIAAHTGFPLHPHADVEIITYVRKGVITHEDDLGNKGHTRAGDVQVMSAGTGIRHSEYNGEDEPTHIFQIWIKPRQRGGEPRWSTQAFPKGDRAGRFIALASGNGAAGALPIRADADLYGAVLPAGIKVQMDLRADQGAYLVPAIGSVVVNGVRVETREGVALYDERSIEVEALSDAEVVLVVASTSS